MHDLRESLIEVLWAILPMAVFVIVLKVVFFEVNLAGLGHLLAGTGMTLGGLVLFLAGARLGILPVGERMGGHLPSLGLWPLLVFVVLMGFAVTVAEPDVRVLALQVSAAAGGYVTHTQLVVTTAIGLGSFLGVAMARMLSGWPLVWFLMGGYGLVALLSMIAPPQVFAIAFDFGGVTTGPLTIPFLMAFNVGLAGVLRGRATVEHSFGTVALASVGAIVAILLLGIALEMGLL